MYVRQSATYHTCTYIYISFAKEPYERDNILRKRPILTYIYHIFNIPHSRKELLQVYKILLQCAMWCAACTSRTYCCVACCDVQKTYVWCTYAFMYVYERTYDAPRVSHLHVGVCVRWNEHDMTHTYCCTYTAGVVCCDQHNTYISLRIYNSNCMLWRTVQGGEGP